MGFYESKHQHVRQGQTTTPGTTCPTLFDKCVGSLTSPAINHETVKMQKTGPTVLYSCRSTWSKFAYQSYEASVTLLLAY